MVALDQQTRFESFTVKAYNNIPITMEERGYHYEVVRCCSEADFKADYNGDVCIGDSFDREAIRYCPYCGKKIKIKKVKDSETIYFGTLLQ